MRALRKVLHIVLAVLLYGGAGAWPSNVQASEWMAYDTSNSKLPDNQIQSVAVDHQNRVWVATARGVACFDGRNWMSYDPANSGIADYYVQCVRIDPNGVVWAGTTKGLSRFDGMTWTTYTAENSPLPHDNVAALTLDAQARLWVSTAGGLAVVDGNNWTVYDSDNSPVLDDLVLSAAIDQRGNTWVGTFDAFQFNGRLLHFNGTTWQREKLDQRGLNSSFPSALAVGGDQSVWMGVKGTSGGALVRVDAEPWTVYRESPVGLLGGVQALGVEGSRVWMATAQGVMGYDGTVWTVPEQLNSALAGATPSSIAVDSIGNKWIATYSKGLFVYNANGVATSVEMPSSAKLPLLLRGCPNPCSVFSVLRYRLESACWVRLSIVDLMGRECAVPVDDDMPAGEHSVELNTALLSEGLYMCVLSAGQTTTTTAIAVVRRAIMP